MVNVALFLFLLDLIFKPLCLHRQQFLDAQRWQNSNRDLYSFQRIVAIEQLSIARIHVENELIMKGFPRGNKNEIAIEFSVSCVTLKSSFLTASIFGGSISPALSLKQSKWSKLHLDCYEEQKPTFKYFSAQLLRLPPIY